MIAANAVLVALFGLAGIASADPKEIKLGTLAPKESAWGKVFGAWAKAVEEESNGALHLTWFYGGSKGDEIAMVGKMRSKELDAAAITATGLAHIWPHVGALQLPGLYPTWAKLDSVRDKLSPKFDKEFGNQGFVILGKGDVGMAHLMSRDFPVRVPDDLKVAHGSILPHPFYIDGDPIGKKVLELIQVPPAQTHVLKVPAILPGVSARGEGAVNIVNAPPIAAEQLGWAPHMNHINSMPSGIGIGALVMLKESFASLPPDAKAVLERTGQNTGRLLTERIRAIDAAAYDRMKRNMTVVDINDTEKAAWAAVFAKVRAALKAEGTIRGDIVDEVTAAAQ
jgi:TRAP-type C4-dicarboxylate transport system substrate-binding protein